jgi:hypothetical protein
MLGIRKRTIAVFVVGLLLGILAGAPIQSQGYWITVNTRDTRFTI